MEGDDPNDEKFKAVQEAQLLSAVSSLEINCTDETDSLALIHSLIDLSYSLTYLTSLVFISVADDVVPLFIDILCLGKGRKI